MRAGCMAKLDCRQLQSSVASQHGLVHGICALIKNVRVATQRGTLIVVEGGPAPGSLGGTC
jgi:hypothetical protein